MKEVKEEVYGSRNSWLKPILESNDIDFFSDLWVATCRNKLNNDKLSRYAVLLESKSNKNVKENIKENVPVYFIKILKNNQIFLENLRNNKSKTLSYKEFIKGFTSKLSCEHISSFAKGSTNASSLSVFFREYMGKGFALTDVDFYLGTSNIMIEEKGFVKDNHCYLGIGQCISFTEIIKDIFNNPKFYIISKQDNKYYMSEIIKLNCFNSKEIEGWGKMNPIKVNETSKEGILNKLL